jgi:RNA polymerase sigma-70 factor (ECF subfamily)
LRSDVERALEVLRQNRAGDVDQALELLQSTVFSFSMKVCGHRQDAEDTSQLTLLRALSSLRRFDDAKALGVWLYKVARSQCLMKRRKSRFAPRRELSLEELMPSPEDLAAETESPERSVLRKDDAARVRRAVQNLPPEYRIILALHDMEELSSAEVAKITGLRPGTVRVRLHRARAFVRKTMSRGDSQGTRRRSADRSTRCKRLFAALSDYLDQELKIPRCEEIESHMAGCPPCRGYLRSLERTVEHLRRMEGGKVDAREAARVRAELRSKYDRLIAAR